MFLKLLVTAVFLMNQLSFGQEMKLSQEQTLSILPLLINNSKDVGTLLESIRPLISESEMQFTREFFTKHGVKDTDTLPKVTTNGNEVIVGDTKLTIAADGMKFNGTIFRQKRQESFDQLVQRIHDGLAGKPDKRSGIFKLIFPAAHGKAKTPGKEAQYKMTEASGAVVGTVGVALTAAIIGISIVLASPVLAVATIGTAVVVGGTAIGIAAFASRNDTRLFCDGKKMTLKSGKEEVTYDFSKGPGQLSPTVKNAKNSNSAFVKKVTNVTPELAASLATVYDKGCVSKKSSEINAAIDRLQKGDFRKEGLAPSLTGTR